MPDSAKLFLGRYRLGGVLGEGATARVFEATDTELSRSVAIKVLTSKAGVSSQERFLAEAQILAGLSHPSILGIYDFGVRDKGQAYLILEKVEGGSLQDLINQGALPTDQVVTLAQKILDGIEYAHAQKVLHRDIKPDNVLLTKDRDPKLSDFGLATAPSRSGVKTKTGWIMGTPEFLSPERFLGEPPGPAADLYSFGGIVHALYFGTPPYQGGIREVFEACRELRLPDISSQGPLVDFFRRVLDPDPNTRAKVPEIRACLEAQRDPAFFAVTARTSSGAIETVLQSKVSKGPRPASRPSPAPSKKTQGYSQPLPSSSALRGPSQSSLSAPPSSSRPSIPSGPSGSEARPRTPWIPLVVVGLGCLGVLGFAWSLVSHPPRRPPPEETLSQDDRSPEERARDLYLKYRNLGIRDLAKNQAPEWIRIAFQGKQKSNPGELQSEMHKIRMQEMPFPGKEDLQRARDSVGLAQDFGPDRVEFSKLLSNSGLRRKRRDHLLEVLESMEDADAVFRAFGLVRGPFDVRDLLDLIYRFEAVATPTPSAHLETNLKDLASLISQRQAEGRKVFPSEGFDPREDLAPGRTKFYDWTWPNDQDRELGILVHDPERLSAGQDIGFKVLSFINAFEPIRPGPYAQLRLRFRLDPKFFEGPEEVALELWGNNLKPPDILEIQVNALTTRWRSDRVRAGYFDYAAGGVSHYLIRLRLPKGELKLGENSLEFRVRPQPGMGFFYATEIHQMDLIRSPSLPPLRAP